MTKRLIKGAVAAVIIVLISIGAYWGYLYRQVRAAASHDGAHVADVIVVLGAAQYNGHPSKVLQARLDHGLTLYKRGFARTIMTTGSYGPDPNFSEAQVATQYLRDHGIDASNIITEQASLTTRDSIRAAAVLMRSRDWKTALVVSDGFHLFRLREMFKDEGIIAYTSPAPRSPIEVSASQRVWFSLREVFLFSAYRLVDL
jgi:uncharacterized SAM-binding protein YcdF (DUF218 family)